MKFQTLVRVMMPLSLVVGLISPVSAADATLSQFNFVQTMDDASYGMKSGLLTATIAQGTCICQFVENLDAKLCLDRIGLQENADMLTEVVINESDKTVTVTPNYIAQFQSGNSTPPAVSRFEVNNPEYGCTLIK